MSRIFLYWRTCGSMRIGLIICLIGVVLWNVLPINYVQAGELLQDFTRPRSWLSSSAEENMQRVASPDVLVDLLWHWGSLVPGGHYRFGLFSYNGGSAPAVGPVEVSTTLPAGVTYSGWGSWGDILPTSGPTVAGRVLTWKYGDMPVGKGGTIEVYVDINPGTSPGTHLTHLAEIEVQPGESNTGNNTSSMLVKVNAFGPNLRVVKDGWWEGIETNYDAHYELHVENIGDTTISNVVLTETFPDGMTLKGGPNVDFDEDWDCETYAKKFTCTLSRLVPGWNIPVTFELAPDILGPGYVYTNTADVTPLTGDVNRGDNQSTYTLFTGPDLKIKKLHLTGDFEPGEEITYLLRHGNSFKTGEWWAGQPWWWGMKGNTIITDTLPDGMSYVSSCRHWCDEEAWNCYDPTIVGQDLIWFEDPMGYYACMEIKVTVAIDSDVAEDALFVNQATIESSLPLVDVDPYPENNLSIHDPDQINIFLPILFR